mmetsp:Transcript_20632/g.26719  ORF Transcript_20632/g.26719 Transcript_20632/m.26719 type:complete len:97 (-) Transcript_20632:54-344(-)
MDSRGTSQTSQPDISHLTPSQQKRLEPEIYRLSCLCKFGCVCACCTACISLLPYWMYMQRVLRLIRRFESENRRGDGPSTSSGELVQPTHSDSSLA